MLDTVSVVTNGGAVLWQHGARSEGRSAMINKLIRDVFLEDRASVREYTTETHRLRWALENDCQFFAVAIYSKFLTIPYVDILLRDLVAKFAAKYGRRVRGSAAFTEEFDFSAEFETLLSTFDDNGHFMRESSQSHLPAEVGEHADDCTRDAVSAHEAEEDEGVPEVSGKSTSLRGVTMISRGGRRIAIRRGATGGRQSGGMDSSVNTPHGGAKKKTVKAPTKWDTIVNDPTVETHIRGPTTEELDAQAEIQMATYIKRLPDGNIAPMKEKEWETLPRGRLANWLRSCVGTRELDQHDFQNVIPKMREKLIGKNVAVDVAEHVCKSVEASLAGKKLGTFDSLHRTVEAAMVSSLRRILQPKHEVNILRDVASAKARKKPYSIVFCGVNGVGKSTSLAKIAYWLQQNGNSVLIAAGDTFRHGAVEQLEVHGRCLGVPVFQMGYGADPSAVAAAAIAQAGRQHTDVVMIDTAGRMQDHQSRMRALAKLIHDNQPDLILFVGEALVGNNGVDQLRKFNQCLVDFAPIASKCRGIDGIVLTKFDTIDDKVGATLSMVYELGQPIVFVGVGQTYQDLKLIEPAVVVSALMQ